MPHSDRTEEGVGVRFPRDVNEGFDVRAEARDRDLRNRRISRERERKRRHGERRWQTIYLLYDARDRLLYVGISANGPARLPQHARVKAWWRKVARCEFEHIKGRSAAEARELELIRSRDPIWNRAGKEVADAAPTA